MATVPAKRGGLLPHRRRRPTTPIVANNLPRMRGPTGGMGAHRRAVTAASMTIDLSDHTEARRLRSTRQGWQNDAMAYTDMIPEISFAMRFSANCSRRMRVFPAIVNPADPDGEPVPIEDVIKAGIQVPQQVIESAAQAMDGLGVGRLAKAQIMEDLAWGLGVVGECWLLGRPTPDTGREVWRIHSVDEIAVNGDEWQLREVPTDPQGQLGWETLTPETSYLDRMWVPHHRFKIMADSPMRACLDVAEELVLLGRDVRAITRSRLAAGILKFPDGLRWEAFGTDNDDPEADPVMGPLFEMMMTPLADDGVASSVVPGVVTGTPENLAALQLLQLARPFSALALELRTEAIGRLANGLDLPRAIILGLETVNHWGQWLISEDTFRHHIEPGVIRQVDCLTKAFLQPWLESDGITDYWASRTVMWYDPVELVTHPDRTADALLLHAALVISDAALRETAGFGEDDAPSNTEIELRMVRNTRAFPPNVLEALFHILDPDLQIPPIAGGGQIPGMGPKGAIPATPPPPAAPALDLPPPPVAPAASPPAAPATPVPPSSPTQPGAPPAASPNGPPIPPGLHTPMAPSISNADRISLALERATGDHLRLSRRLAATDAELRARIQVAANAAMTRVLERAGAKVRTQVTKTARRDNAPLVASIEGVPNRQVAAQLGQPVVAAIGFADSKALLDANWSDLKTQFLTWVKAAGRQQVATAAKLAGIPAAAASAVQARTKLDAAATDAWTAFSDSLDTIAESQLYSPAPSATDQAVFNPMTVVSMGAIRAVLAIAGGQSATATAQTTQPTASPSGAPVPQLGNGPVVSDMLTTAGMEQAAYEWVHNYGGTHPFDPHEELTGTLFTSFTTDALVNDNDWPDVPFYKPGDHTGCVCDYACLWVPGVALPKATGGDVTAAPAGPVDVTT